MGATATAAPPPMRGLNPLYPCSDGQPMAESGLQYQWITTLQGNLEAVFRDRPDVFVAADNLVYPVQGRPDISRAPDVYVVFGVPKGHRGSFIVHEEGVFPQVVFEVRSPSNRSGGMAKKLDFYNEYGADEYYDFDPVRNRLRVYLRDDGQLDELPDLPSFTSPRLGVRFDLTGPELAVYRPDGRRFLTREELERETERSRRQVDAAAAENARLRELLRKAGLDPDAAG